MGPPLSLSSDMARDGLLVYVRCVECDFCSKVRRLETKVEFNEEERRI